MSIAAASSLVALTGTAIILIWFIVVSGVYKFREDPFFARGQLQAVQIRANLAATATSLAGALFFFMNNTAAFGWVMLLVPVFNVLGILLFVKIVKNLETSPNVTGSIFRHLFHRLKSIRLARFANIIVIVNFIAIFVIEIVIGSTIFNYFFNSKIILIVISLVLSMTAFVYVMRGGFDAVTQTDRWQFWLVVIGFCLSLITVFIASPAGILNVESVGTVFQNPQLPKGFQYAFLVNALLINLFLPATQVSSWERYSSGTREEAIKGFWQGALFFILPIWLISIVTAATTIVISGSSDISFVALFDLIRSYGPAPALIVFPILFMGLVAALLSTADSLMISTMLAVSDFKKFRINPTSGIAEGLDLSVDINKSVMWKTGCFMVISALIITVLVSYSPNINKTVTQLLFAAYGMPCLLFPIVAYGCVKLEVESFRLWTMPVICGLAVGLLVLWAGAIFGMISGSFYGTLLGPVAGIAIAGIGVMTGHIYREAR